MSFTFQLIGFASTVAYLNTVPARVQAAAGVGLTESVKKGEELVKSYASGPPGPTPRTGKHRASIKGVVLSLGPVSEGQIGSSVIYAPRLEFGFVGPDSLGRVYNQAPRPHFAPAVNELKSFTLRAVSQSIKAGL